MALQLHDLTAWIAISDRSLEVYGIEKSAPNHVSCWIASEAGKKFSVNWRSTTRALPLQGTVIIDGLECNNHIMLDAQSYPDRPNSVGISFARTSNYTQRDFMFSAFQVTDDNAYLDRDDAHNDQPFGVITLEIYRLHVINVMTQPTPHVANQSLGPRTVHSRSPKAGTHQVRYADEYYSPAPIVDIVAGCRTGDGPYAVFTFKYRPLESLMNDGIVPRSTRDFKIVLDPATEIAQLEARLAELRSKGSTRRTRGASPYAVAGSSRVKGNKSRGGRNSKGNKASDQTTVVIDLTTTDDS